jgi:Ala-tRNA(Pro) deacylase
MECRDRLEDYLRENGVPFEVQHHPRAITAQEVAATEHVPGKMLAKVVMVLADGEMVMLTLPAPYQVDLEKVGKVLGAEEARLAEEEEFEVIFPDCEVGAMPPFGNLYELPVYVEEGRDDILPGRYPYRHHERQVRRLQAAGRAHHRRVRASRLAVRGTMFAFRPIPLRSPPSPLEDHPSRPLGE